MITEEMGVFRGDSLDTGAAIIVGMLNLFSLALSFLLNEKDPDELN